MSYTKTEWKTGDIITADKMNKLEEGVSQLSETMKDISASETTGISAELTTALRLYFTNVQTILPQIAYVTENNIGNTLIQNAKDVVSVLGGGEAEEPTLTSISATYGGGEVAIETALTDLTGITVTGTYSDGSTSEITGYTLSGEIVEGNNTITVSYSGLTTTFTVIGIVVEEEKIEPVYRLAEATTFDGATSIDTGYMLNDEDRDWSVVTEFSASAKTSCVWDSSQNGTGAVQIKCPNSYHWRAQVVGGYADIGHSTVANLKVIMTHKKGIEEVECYFIPDENGTKKDFTSNVINIQNGLNTANYKHSKTLRLGSDYTGASNYFTGTIHTFEIYERVLTSEEINTFMGV